MSNWQPQPKREPLAPQGERGLEASRRIGKRTREDVERLRERMKYQDRCPERARQPKAVGE